MALRTAFEGRKEAPLRVNPEPAARDFRDLSRTARAEGESQPSGRDVERIDK